MRTTRTTNLSNRLCSIARCVNQWSACQHRTFTTSSDQVTQTISAVQSPVETFTSSTTKSAPVSIVLKFPEVHEVEFGHLKMVHWMKKVGDTFSEGDSLAEIDSDIATIEYKAQTDGVLALIVAHPGHKLHPNSVLAVACENLDQINAAIAEYEQAEGPLDQDSKQNQ